MNFISNDALSAFLICAAEKCAQSAMERSPVLAKVRVGSIVLRVDNLRRQTEFWAAALDYVPREENSEDFVLLRRKDGNGPNLSLDRHYSELRTPPRIHLDLYTDNQAEEVRRLTALGATEIHWSKRPANADYLILADPEGNRFCVVDVTVVGPSAAESAQFTGAAATLRIVPEGGGQPGKLESANHRCSGVPPTRPDLHRPWTEKTSSSVQPSPAALYCSSPIALSHWFLRNPRTASFVRNRAGEPNFSLELSGKRNFGRSSRRDPGQFVCICGRFDGDHSGTQRRGDRAVPCIMLAAVYSMSFRSNRSAQE